MKNLILILMLNLFFSCYSQNKDDFISTKLLNNHIDNLSFISENLTEDNPDYKFRLDTIKGFNIDTVKERIIGVNIYDLNTGEGRVYSFQNDHVYHISPINLEDSFSYILCVNQNKMVLFKSINCTDRGDELKDVLDYLNSNTSHEAETIKRLKNYRKYGVYMGIDDMTALKCKCNPCE